MPFKPGTPKPANSGRRKGQAAAIKETVEATLARMNCSPIEGMVRIAQNAAKKQSIQHQRLAGHLFGELAQYEHPKRRAIEMSGIDGNPIEVTINAREQLLSRIASLSPRKP